MIRASLLLLSIPTFGASMLAQVVATPPQAYYVSNNGNDAAAGTSPTTAWRTLNHVQRLHNLIGLQPGDSILLERGSKFDEGFELNLLTNGTATAKITLGDYGTAAQPPTISRRSSDNLPTCVTIGGEYWVIKGIRFEEAHRGLSLVGNVFPTRGVEVLECTFRNIDDRSSYADMPVGIRLTQNAFRSMSIRRCVFDHVGLGIQVETGQDSQGLTIAQCEAYGGWGAGFALQNVKDSLVSEFIVRDTGGQSNAGTTGGFLVSCTNVQVDRCSFSGVKHSGGPDGCGFDFEGGNRDCSLTNCTIFDNEGPAILMLSGGGPNTNITIANCNFYDNNRRLHSYPGAPWADSVLFLAVGNDSTGAPYPSSTGQFIDCGIHKPGVASVSYRAAGPNGTWSGFGSTNTTSALQCEGWIPVPSQYETGGSLNSNVRMRHVSVGSRGHICAVGVDQKPYEWNGAATGAVWKPIAGLALVDTLSVGEDGELWATDPAHNVYRHAGAGAWTVVPGRMGKVSVGSANNIWGLDVLSGGPAPVYAWRNGAWSVPSAQLMTDIDAGPTSGQAWGVSGTSVYRFRNAWTLVPGISLDKISLHGQSTVYEIAAGVVGTAVKRTVDGVNWEMLPGNLVEVAEGSDGTLWGVDASGYVWRAR